MTTAFTSATRSVRAVTCVKRMESGARPIIGILHCRLKVSRLEDDTPHSARRPSPGLDVEQGVCLGRRINVVKGRQDAEAGVAGRTWMRGTVEKQWCCQK